ncbi:hypothetical protein BJ170DRAFT_598985 [Xylariales sp. AK1849]|nr:hypothetical protein BJ170DRAFT_598985 [Xylariales sp. AK1849]
MQPKPSTPGQRRPESSLVYFGVSSESSRCDRDTQHYKVSVNDINDPPTHRLHSRPGQSQPSLPESASPKHHRATSEGCKDRHRLLPFQQSSPDQLAPLLHDRDMCRSSDVSGSQCPPPHPSAKTARRVKERSLTAYWDHGINDEGVIQWLSDIRTSPVSMLDRHHLDRPDGRRTRSDSAVCNTGDINACPKLASITAAKRLQNPVHASQDKLSSFRPEEYMLHRSDVNWVNFYKKISPLLSSRKQTDKPSSDDHSNFVDQEEEMQELDNTSCSRSRFGSGFDGSSCPVKGAIGNFTTGFGPLSVPPPGASTVDQHPRQTSATTSGMIDWEKSWFKRKPRRVHNVSEVSVPDPAIHTHAIDLFSMAVLDDEDSSDEESRNLACPRVVEHHAQSHDIQMFTLKSCPELHRTMDDCDKKRGKQASNIAMLAVSHGNRVELTRTRYPMRDAMSRRFRSWTRKFRHSSSVYSVRSDFPAPLDSKERRLQARGSTDIYPSSGDKITCFNSPASGRTPMASVERLVSPGVHIASEPLDRYSEMTRQSEPTSVPDTPSASGILPNSLDSQIVLPSLTGNPESLMTAFPTLSTHTPPGKPSGSGILSVTSTSTSAVPPLPQNTPPSTPTTSTTPSHTSNPPIAPLLLRRGQQRRTVARSRLFEVTTPEDWTTPELSPELPTPSAINALDDLAIDDTEDDDRHRTFSRPLRTSTASKGNSSAGEEFRTPRPSPNSAEQSVSSPTPMKEAVRLAKAGTILELWDVIGSIAKGEGSIPWRSTSSHKSTDCGDQSIGQTISAPPIGGMSFPLGARPHVTSTASSPSKIQNISEPPADKPMPVHLVQNDVPHAESESLGKPGFPSATVHRPDTGSNSCHADTWDPSQGEPGDSDPFCPPGCDTRHSHETVPAESRPTTLFRKSTSGTVMVLDRVEPAGSEESLGDFSDDSLGGCGRGCVLED